MTAWKISIAGVLAILVAVSPALVAQWPAYPTPGVPRTADGQPILDAPTPRTPEGKVDFSGIWNRSGGGGGGRARGGAPAPTTTPEGIPLSGFGEVTGRGFALPLQPWAAELKGRRMADKSKDNPDVWCLPTGLMQYHNHPQPRQIVQTKDLMLITYESNYGLRYIYLDGADGQRHSGDTWIHWTVTIVDGTLVNTDSIDRTTVDLSGALALSTGGLKEASMKRRVRLLALLLGTAPSAAIAQAPHATAVESTAARLQRVEDKEEIQALLLDYGCHLDSRDFAAFERLWAKDAEFFGGITW